MIAMILVLMRQEALKLAAQRYPYLLLAALLALQALRMLTLGLTPPATALDVVSAPQLWADGMAWALRLLAFAVLVQGALAFSGEFALGTAKTVLLLPVRRRDWCLAKLATLVLLAWGLLAVLAVLGAALVAATLGWGDVVREGIVLRPLAQVWRQLLLGLGLTALQLLPLCAFALLVGLYFSNAGAAVGVAVLLGMVLEAAGGLLGPGRYVFLYQLHRPLALLERMGKGLPFSWDEALGTGLAVAAAWFVALSAAAWLRLERMDIVD
jgi:ABC-type transport system involved in multi-copper enzyme maturation permease subunit